MKQVLDEVIAKVKPGDEEVRESFGLFDEISSFIKEKYSLPASLMGSVAKDTFLTGDKDLDIFVLFPVSFSREDLERTALEIGKTVFLEFGCKDYVISYAEHPYTKGVIKGFEVEIVPAYNIRSTKQLMSAVDRTPFHTKFVVSNLKNHDEVRIFKKFLKGIGCYGSDLKTEGFSGYLCELLIMHYGGFPELIKEAQGWKYQEIVDISGFYSSSNMNKVRKCFDEQPLIVIDPIDKKRNVAAVLSMEKLARFMVYSKKFIKKPERKYFFPRKKKIDAKKIWEDYENRGFKIYAVCFESPDIIDDVLYPQLRRLEANFRGYLKRSDFVVDDSWVFANKECGIGLKVINTTVPKYRIVKGPTIFNPSKHQENFIKTHKKVWIDDDRYVTEVQRDCVDIDDCMRMFFRGSVDELVNRGVPRNLAVMISKKTTILKGRKIVNIKSEEFFEGLMRDNIKS